MTSLLRKAGSKIGLLAGAAALAATAGLATATPAAAGTPDRCNGLALCLFEHSNYDGTAWVWFSVPRSDSVRAGNDATSSLVNNSANSLCFYENQGTGLEFRIGPWERWGSVPSWINDKISSFRIC
ncbi:peptidase inhibitor family I36 protein [Streptomyces sp. NPDC093252]|uniref:peptidase inhibitor family I36 protein n=1 Tax=Streptomyces sp. NPDC093252 TaxID=3154980 RepID=UPI00343A3988